MRIQEATRVLVVDLGFGDAGKGTVTDFLVRQKGARAVVRFNGGAQAGHNVVTPDGRHHTFAQLGAGTFVPGVRTFLSKHVVFHPTALLIEAQHLARAGVSDALERITVSEECLVTTPFHQAATCLRELARGPLRHGSCGVGVGETMKDSLAAPDRVLRAKELRDVPRLVRLLRTLQAEKRAELSHEIAALGSDDLARQQQDILEDPGVVDAWVDSLTALVTRRVIEDDTRLHALCAGNDPIVFEGAQGVLLDEWKGFHPFTTWSTCTFDNAVALLAEHGSSSEPFRLGVTRSFATRHGPGPFPTESEEVPAAAVGAIREHNVFGPWQGRFRTGWLDAVLLRYACEAAGGIDGLAVTHLDRFSAGRECRLAESYEHRDARAFATGPDDHTVTSLKVGPPRDLAHTAALASALERTTPRYTTLPHCAKPHDAIVHAIEGAIGSTVVLRSWGPTATEKSFV